MGKKRVLLPADRVNLSAVKYEHEVVQAPHLTGFVFKFFVKILEIPFIGSFIIAFMKKKNKIDELLTNTKIPEAPMFKPEYPPQEMERGVLRLEDDWKPEVRVESALKCLPHYDPAATWNRDSAASFRYWKIRDFGYAYRSKLVTPTEVAEQIISVILKYGAKKPPAPLLISFSSEDVRKQAAASTQRFKEGNPISILDGIFMAIKDDIDCLPHPSKGATTWVHECREVKADAVCVSRLRSCGVILVGKANMHELGMGTTGNNSNYGTTRNPHAPDRYTGGSSSGPAAIVASGICSAALGTDGGGSIRIPSSLCGVVGLKTTYGRTDRRGVLCDGTVEIVGPIASSVEDIMLIYAAMLGSSPEDRMSLSPSSPCLPDLSLCDSSNILGTLRVGKYTPWFNDVHSTEVSDRCENVLTLLSRTYGIEIREIVVPELHEMRTAHVVSIGSEARSSLNPDIEEGKGERLTCDTRTSMALFQTFSAADYVAAQRLRRRLMYYHMEIFKNVDVIVTPTTGMTAPKIPPSALKHGETNIQVTAYLMRFVITANLLGFPAISIPIGYDKEGLPIGLQLIGRPWGEATILRLASAVEELVIESKKKPVSFYDVLKAN